MGGRADQKKRGEGGESIFGTCGNVYFFGRLKTGQCEWGFWHFHNQYADMLAGRLDHKAFADNDDVEEREGRGTAA